MVTAPVLTLRQRAVLRALWWTPLPWLATDALARICDARKDAVGRATRRLRALEMLETWHAPGDAYASHWLTDAGRVFSEQAFGPRPVRGGTTGDGG